MTEDLRQWMLTVFVTGIVLCGVECLLPEGAGRTVGKIAGGLVLFLVVVGPCLEHVPSVLRKTWEENIPVRITESGEVGDQVMEKIMSQKCEEYIRKEAGISEIDVSVQVNCATREGLPIPESVHLAGIISNPVKEKLESILKNDLGIEQDRIFWEVKPNEVQG